MRRPRAIVIGLEPAWPAAKGIARRLEALTQAVASVSDVVLVDASASGSDGGRPPDCRVVRLPRSRSRLFAAGGMLAALLSDRPLTTAYICRRRLRRDLRALLQAEEPDVVVVHGIGGAALVRGMISPGRVVLDLADAEPGRFRGLGTRMGMRGIPYRLDVARTKRWCRRHLPTYAAVSVVSEDDAAVYAELAPTAALVLIPNGVALPAMRRPEPQEQSLMFLGDLTYPPNAEALQWLATEVLPLMADVRVRVVGSGPVPEHPRLQATGFVPDLAPEWQRATCLVAPIRSGGGTRVKVLEAFAAGVPVVSTQLGASGLHAVPGVHYLRAETAVSFAAEVERVTSDPDLRNQLAEAARALVAERFQWTDCTQPIAEAVLTIGRGRAPHLSERRLPPR